MKILFDHTSDLMSVGRRVASVIQSLGYEAYIVGGAARDLMMGIENIHDIDISTNMPISVIKQNWKTVEYGGGNREEAEYERNGRFSAHGRSNQSAGRRYDIHPTH